MANASQATDTDFRKKWDKEEYAERAKKRDVEERERMQDNEERTRQGSILSLFTPVANTFCREETAERPTER